MKKKSNDHRRDSAKLGFDSEDLRNSVRRSIRSWLDELDRHRLKGEVSNRSYSPKDDPPTPSR